jgi:3-methyl-2-oxobutanoate hydroxymethyltransferase
MPTVPEIRERAGQEPITMLTAYDSTTAAIVEDAGVDVVLVGDSLGTTTLGYDSTLSVTVDDVARHTGAVTRATEEALVVADMPFLSVGAAQSESIRNAGRMLKEAGADAVKLECGPHTVDLTERLVELGIPVLAHLGLTPQRINQLGGYTQQGQTEAARERLRELAREHETAGAFACVLEHVPAALAAQITADREFPTIGIGAGPECDGQVLVVNDAVGLTESPPPFAAAFADVRAELRDGVEGYVEAVENGDFPPDAGDTG